jgi:hypothetical protein
MRFGLVYIDQKEMAVERFDPVTACIKNNALTTGP